MTRVSHIAMTITTLLALMVLIFDNVHSSTIIIAPFPSYSHVNPLAAMGDILIQGGHSVHMYLPSLYTHMTQLKANSKVKVIEYQVKAWEWNAAMYSGKVDTETDFFDYMTHATYLSDIKNRYNGYHLLCRALMSSKIIDLHIKHGLTFDLGIIDSHPLTRCQYALMHKHGIPFVSYNQVYDPWFMGAPAMPSYVPSFLTEGLTEQMTLWQRVVNVWTVLYWTLGIHLPAQTTDFIEDYVTGKEAMSITELARQSRLWLSDTNFLVDYARPMISNEILISTSLMQDAKMLPNDHPALTNINSTKDGIILISLDQNIALPARVVTAFLTTFKIMTTHHIIWHYTGDLTDETVPNNVRVLSSAPLNDLIGHPQTKLLVTSCDRFHQNMALYHGVPILCIPLHPAQRNNAIKTHFRSHGIVISPDEFNLKNLVQTIKKMVQNDTYYQNVQEPSSVMKKHQQTAQKSAIDWIEMSIVNDLDEFKPYAMTMPAFQYHMFDIFLLFCIIFGNIGFLFSNVSILGLRNMCTAYKNRKLAAKERAENSDKNAIDGKQATPAASGAATVATPATALSTVTAAPWQAAFKAATSPVASPKPATTNINTTTTNDAMRQTK